MSSPNTLRFAMQLIIGLELVCISVNATGTRKFIPAQVASTNWGKELLVGVEKTEDFPAWLAGMRAYRQENVTVLEKQRATITDPYAEPAVQWAQRSFIQPLMMAHDRYFFDPRTGRYTVDRYLEDLQKRYGGIDSVLIWPTYPNIGVDNRNQFDLWRDMPGGVPGLRQMVRDFHRREVKVFMPIMIWDQGTRDEGLPMASALAQLAKEIEADGLNGDTMSPVDREFYTEALRIHHPLALEPENGLGGQIEALAWNVLSWGYWWPYQKVPAVDRYKWIEPRHLTLVCDRWAQNRTEMLQLAFFNGDGYVSWENIWGIWNQVSPRDAEALRRISAIYRAVPELLTSPSFEPFTPTLQKDVFAARFPGKGATLWTFINRSAESVNGPQIEVPFSSGAKFYDLWHGSELKPATTDAKATLAFELEGHGYGAILETHLTPAGSVKKLLASRKPRERIHLGDLPTQWRPLPQKIVEIPRTTAASIPSEGMIRIPASKYKFVVEGVMIEKGDGVDVQYPWEDKPNLKHEHELTLTSFYIDKTPVTCAQFKRFLDATRYHPKDSHNFLRSWTNGSYPANWANKPVTWVSLEDARAFAKWAGKRLPHEWEWQYAAQGTDERLYPWGNQMEESRVPRSEKSREQRAATDVEAYPQGASPFGVLDLVGNVWQWTDEFQDEHTRAAILKGGSYYRPDKSMWYFPQAHQLNQHGKYLLLAPSMDRSATIGFRCVVDAD